MNLFKRTPKVESTPTTVVMSPVPTPSHSDYQWAVNQALDRLGSTATVGQLAETARQLLVWEYKDSRIDTTKISNLLITPPFI